MNSKKLYTIEEVALMLSTTKTRITNWLVSGEIQKSYDADTKEYGISQENIDDFLDTREA